LPVKVTAEVSAIIIAKSMKKKKISEGEKVKAGKENENKGLQAALDEIREKFGEGAIMTLKDVKAVDVDVIPTGLHFAGYGRWA